MSAGPEELVVCTGWPDGGLCKHHKVFCDARDVGDWSSDHGQLVVAVGVDITRVDS